MNICSAMKVILLTGSTDGIGLEAAKQFVAAGHHVVVHGRNPTKLAAATAQLQHGPGTHETHIADLSQLADVDRFAQDVLKKHDRIDVLINNAGVLQTEKTRTDDGLDVRFAVNTIAPYLLVKRLLPLIPKGGRLVNLSSAAQSPVDLGFLSGQKHPVGSHFEAYSQSKLALTMWNAALAKKHTDVVFVALNPASMIGTKMVKEGFGMEGQSLSVGADIIFKAALDGSFAKASGKYFDNDRKAFGSPHKDALNDAKCQEVVDAIEDVLTKKILVNTLSPH